MTKISLIRSANRPMLTDAIEYRKATSIAIDHCIRTVYDHVLFLSSGLSKIDVCNISSFGAH
jgi:hypothetical protein